MLKNRLVSDDERPRWKDTMKETYEADESDVPVIDAQWDARKAIHQPPDAFDEHVKYRSVVINTFQ